MITSKQYAELKKKQTIYDRWAKQFEQSNGWTVIPSEEPRPVEFSNEERSQIELFELHRDRPQRFTAYLAKGGQLHTWCGDRIGTWIETGRWEIDSYLSNHMVSVLVKADWGMTYVGRGCGVGMSINLRAKKHRG